MSGTTKGSNEDLLAKLRQKTALSPDELKQLQTVIERQETALAGSHHFAISHHGIVADNLPGVLDRS